MKTTKQYKEGYESAYDFFKRQDAGEDINCPDNPYSGKEFNNEWELGYENALEDYVEKYRDSLDEFKDSNY